MYVSGLRRSWLTVATKSDFIESSSLKRVMSRNTATRPSGGLAHQDVEALP